MFYLHLFMCTMSIPGASGIQKWALVPGNGVTDGRELLCSKNNTKSLTAQKGDMSKGPHKRRVG